MKRIKKLLNIIKDYYPMIAILPLLLGGLLQCYFLLEIDISYLRFFSATQLLSDGIIVLLIFFAIFMFMGLLALIFGTRKALLYVGPGLVLIFLLYQLILNGFSSISIQNWVAIFVIGLSWFFSFKKRNILLSLGFLVVVVTYMIYATFIYVRGGVGMVNETFDYSKIGNMRNLECVIQAEPFEVKSYKLLYFNDKYLFVKLEIGNESKVWVYPFKEFYNSDKCNTVNSRGNSKFYFNF